MWHRLLKTKRERRCEESEQRLLQQLQNVPGNREGAFLEREFRSRGRVPYSARKGWSGAPRGVVSL